MEHSSGLGHNGPPAEVPADEVAPGIFNDYWDGYIDDLAAADFIGFTPKYLRNLRHQGGGPPYSKIRQSVRYTRRRLKSWADEQILSSTSDPGREAA